MNDLTPQLLPLEVARLTTLGWRVEATPTPGQVVMVRGKRPNHILHLLLSLVTFGLWLPVWLVIGLSSSERRVVLSEDALRSPRPPVPAVPWWRDWVIAGAVTAVLVAGVILFG